MDLKLREVKNISSENCITIIMNTHRTKPDYLKDELHLKNLIKEAENRLFADLGKRDATILLDKLHKLAGQIDHSHNLESLLLFVNEDIAEYTRLPIAVEDRLQIDNTFATRDLVRAMHLKSNYYVLVLSQEKVRLIEALNDKVIKEFKSAFPIENKTLFARSKAESAIASRKSNLIAEFFNQVDKAVNSVRQSNPLPVLICTVEENYSEYLKIADQKQSIFDTYLNKNRIKEKSQAIVSEAWKVVQEYTIKKNNARKSELQKAVTENKFLSDTNDIWRAIAEGRIQTLFIEQGLFQPAIMKDNEITYVPNSERNNKGIIDDIYDEMIEENMRFGGDVVFLPGGELKDFNGFVAISRY